MLNLSSAVQALAGAAGWHVADPDELGVYHYFLEEGLDMDIQSPDGRLCVMSTDLGDAPSESDPSASQELRRLGTLAAGILRSRGSVLSVQAGRLELFRAFDLRRASEDDAVREGQAFLNDQAWWRSQLGGSAGLGQSFSFGADWFPSEFSFR
ncbi:MAG: hypothetical protein HUK26_03565 [Duodenibacillus sp.]|nr:hypothetical protein [Duodenibacillus sp.]